MPAPGTCGNFPANYDPYAPLQNLDDPPLAQAPPGNGPAPAAHVPLTPFTTAKRVFQATEIDTSKIDSRVELAHALNDQSSFSFFQVEQLLGQCASLLERGLASQGEYQTLGEKSFATWLELREFIALDAIHAYETTAGYYANAEISSAGERDAQGATKEGALNARNELAGWAGIDNVDAQNVGLNAERKEYDGELNAAGVRADVATTRAQYDVWDQWFQRSRTEAARLNVREKLLAYTAPNVAYNYEQRRSVLRTRFEADFANALARVGAIETGLELLYGIPWTMDAQLAPFDAAVLAVRDALEALTEFGVKEQNYILPISLKTLLGPSWDAGFSADNQTGIWSLPIDGSLFPDQAHVRLRGVSATVNVSDPVGLYQAAFNVPSQGEVTFADKSVQPSLDQTSIPLTRIGRIRAANFQHPPDVVGTLSLNNATPIGYRTGPEELSQWLFGISSSQIPLSQAQLKNGADGLATVLPTAPDHVRIDDVTLYLYLAVRST